jgi:hypothetical protein
MFNRLIFNNITTEFFLLLAGLLTLIYHFLLFPISNDSQMIILLSLVLLVGVPHGALDFLVDEQNETLRNNVFSLKKFGFSHGWLFQFLLYFLFFILEKQICQRL